MDFYQIPAAQIEDPQAEGIGINAVNLSDILLRAEPGRQAVAAIQLHQIDEIGVFGPQGQAPVPAVLPIILGKGDVESAGRERSRRIGGVKQGDGGLGDGSFGRVRDEMIFAGQEIKLVFEGGGREGKLSRPGGEVGGDGGLDSRWRGNDGRGNDGLGIAQKDQIEVEGFGYIVGKKGGTGTGLAGDGAAVHMMEKEIVRQKDTGILTD